MSRERLLDQLSTSSASLVVISAPGGFGKTVTLAQWTQRSGLPMAWLQADAADNDPLALLSYILAALDDVVSVSPLLVEWLQLAPPPVETRILPGLATAIQGAPPFVLVVDDAHLITNEACWQLLGLLLAHLPPHAHLCVSGRTPPPLPLARLRAAGSLLELGPAELSLSFQETRDLLHLHGVYASPETVAHLEEVTEGWAAGVCLAALASAGADSAEWLAGIHGHQHDIARYLASEVLEQQPADVAAFLLQTSILERLSPSLCRAVTSEERAGDLLRAVARSNLFVSALDDADEWFRYHHLFAEFLETELLHRQESSAVALHSRAAAWFEEHDQLEEAVGHWLAAGNPGAAGSIICRAHTRYTGLGRYETIRRWLDMFTDDQIFSDEALTLAAGWIGVMAGDSPRGRKWTTAAMRRRVGDGMWPGAPIPLRAMQALLIATLAPEGVTQMRVNAELALALSADAPASARSVAITQLGIACWLAADNATALKYFKDGEAEGAIGNVLAQIVADGYQALIRADEGRWVEARQHTDMALRRFEEAGLSWGVPVYPALLARTRMLAHDGDPAVAEQITMIGEFVAQGNTQTFMAMVCEVIAGEVLAARGDLTEARRWLRAGLAHLAVMPDAGILQPRLLRLQALLEQRQMLEALTPAERRVLELLPTELTVKEIASRLWVSRETVHTHVRDIYRKLEVHSRGEAVARARELELLDTA